MGVWLIVAAMTALAVGLVLYPLVRGPRASSTRREHNLAVYRAQLEELRQERERGLLGPKEAEAAELEVKRRMLAADADEKASLRPASAGAAKGVPLMVALGLPLLSLALYWQLGTPDQAAAPFAAREAEREQLAAARGDAALPSVEALVARLEERVETEPADLEAWLRLGRAYSMLEQHEAAARAYAEALALRDDLPSIQAARGEALILAAEGVVTEPARAALSRALELDPTEPRARFYQGLALAQRGEQNEALEVWLDLLGDSPPDAPWLEPLRLQIAGLAEAMGRDPDELMAAAGAAGARAEAPRETAEGPIERRARALRIETELESVPKNWQGWIELARLWSGLGDTDRARLALERGEEAYAGAPFVQGRLRQAAADLGLTEAAPRQPGPSADEVQAAEAMNPEAREAMIRDMVGGLAARLEQTPDDPEGWRMLGRSYQVLGEPEKSAEAYAQLAALLPEDVEAQLDYARALLELDGQNGPLGAELVGQMERVLVLDQDNPAALFWLGRAAQERSEPAEAARYWERLLAQMPPGAPERRQVEELIERVRDGG